MTPPGLIFGAGGIGTTAESFTFTWATPESVSALLSTLRELGILQLDSAASYPPGNFGNTETLLGQSQAAASGFIIDSKVSARTIDNETIPASLNKTLSLLGASKLRTLYAHHADGVTPVEITAAAFDKEYRAGKFERVHGSNFVVFPLMY